MVEHMTGWFDELSLNSPGLPPDCEVDILKLLS